MDILSSYDGPESVRSDLGYYNLCVLLCFTIQIIKYVFCLIFIKYFFKILNITI